MSKAAEHGAPRAVRWGDSVAAGVLGGLPFTGAPMTAASTATIAWGDPRGSSAVLTLADRPGFDLAVDRVALDRSGVAAGLRPWPPPQTVLAVCALGPSDPAPDLTTYTRRVVTTDSVSVVNLGRSSTMESVTSLKALAVRARSARIVLISPHAFRDRVTLARVVVHVAASGVPCALLDGRLPVPFLDPVLAEAIDLDLELVMTDDHEWAAASARQLRAAWLGHALSLRWNSAGEGWRPQVAPIPLPSVSVLLASRRPELVPAALRMIAGQHEVRPEVIVSLHVDDEGPVAGVRRELEAVGLAGEVFSVQSTVPLGAMIDLAVERASGTLVTKWDDDDRYGPHHLADLIAAMRRSGADMVGKANEFVYFADSDETIHHFGAGAFGKGRWVAGSTFMLERATVHEIGGFPPLWLAEDWHLQRRVKAVGLEIHRTHGFGYVYVRSGSGHTWAVDQRHFRKNATRIWKGIPAICDV